MIEGLTPAAIFLLGAIVTAFLRGGVQKAFILMLPVLGFAQFILLDPSDQGVFLFDQYRIVTLRIDHLSMVFAVIFHIAAFLVLLFALHVKDTMQHVATLTYAGAAIGAVLAGDVVTLFLFWELTAVASVFLIWARRTEQAIAAGMRYVLVNIGSGLLLLMGVILYARESGSLSFDHMQLDSISTWLIFIAFGIKCGFPLLHNWIQDAYPEATVTGTVVLASFTTKLAVYALARGFAGESLLIPIGAVMAVFPVFYAMIDNDMRRLLAYSLNNQLGFMVVGIGIGTELAINGALAHAFNNILFKGLLLMSIGAVLLRTGTAKASELGALYKTMPWTAGLCLIGAASISAFPLFSGFVSKAMILHAVATEGHWLVWLVLLFASSAVVLYLGIKIPYFTFFAKGSESFAQGTEKRHSEAPPNMMLAMGIAAALCVLLGIYPQPLYALLPYTVDFAAYTRDHVLTMLQLLLFSSLAFILLKRYGLYPVPMRSINLDSDWIYRRLLPRLLRWFAAICARVTAAVKTEARQQIEQATLLFYRHFGPQSILARTSTTGITVLWVAVLFGVTLLIYYV